MLVFLIMKGEGEDRVQEGQLNVDEHLINTISTVTVYCSRLLLSTQKEGKCIDIPRVEN